MKEYRRICADIDLDALTHNLDEIHRCIRKETKIIAVVKADGYGHGAVPLAEVMEKREDVWGYAVATPEEAEELYTNGIKKPILILGYTPPEYAANMIVQENLRPAVFSLIRAKQLSEEAMRQDKICKIHIKLDTGMSRIGFQVTEQSADEIAQIAKLPHIMIEGIFTHFSKADETDKAFTKKQEAAYEQMITWLKERQVSIPVHHVSNSAGIVDLPEYNKDIVRAGIILYGLWPSDEVNKENIDLQPLLSLKSHVVHVKELEPGRIISYGGTFEVEHPMRIATVPVGYADGYPRSLSNQGYVLIHGKKAPILGRVCMDQFMVDVSLIPEASQGDEVTLIGRDGEESITMEELGELSGRFNYELACCLNKRVPRIYTRDGKVVYSKDSFRDFR